MAISLSRQGQNLSREVFDGIFSAMRDEDSDRILITGLVHIENVSSREAARRVGIDAFQPVEGGYIRVIGNVPDEGD